MIALHALAVWFAANGPIQLYLGLAGFDILTGILQSFKERKVSSEVCRDGLIRKAGMVLAVLLGKFLEYRINQPIGAMLAVSFCLPEGLSIVENLTGLGVPIPAILTQYFKKLGAFPQTIPSPLTSKEALDGFADYLKGVDDAGRQK